jgi:hypothetical protein
MILSLSHLGLSFEGKDRAGDQESLGKPFQENLPVTAFSVQERPWGSIRLPNSGRYEMLTTEFAQIQSGRTGESQLLA